MGCGVSRLDGYGMVLPAKFHPIKTFHYARPLKKELLLQDHVVEDSKYSSLPKNAPHVVPMAASSLKENANPEEHEEKNGENCKNDVKEKRMERVIKAANDVDKAETDGGDQMDDDEDDDERRIGAHVDDDDDDEAFRGSPSFRVYFKDHGEEKHNGHENDASISSDEAKSSKEQECCEDKKVMKKRGIRKKKSYSKNYKGVKNLLNYKSCYNTTPSSGPDHANLILTGKTSARSIPLSIAEVKQ